VNSEVAGAMLEHVLDVAGEGSQAVDAYCGAGLYGRGLAERGWMVRGVERDRTACEEATRNAPSGFTVVQGAVESQLAAVLPADLLIVNPPRSGLDADVLRVVKEGSAPRVVYVSCDPATLARDVAGISPTYAVESLKCFDLFPQTAHVETVMVLRSREVAP
jgi:23S rRNA (uracil1939-C5)-methyltransferase